MKNGTRKGRSLSPGALSVLRAMIEAYEEGRERGRTWDELLSRWRPERGGRGRGKDDQ